MPYSFKKSVQIHFLIFLVTAILTVIYMKSQEYAYTTYNGVGVMVSYTPSMIIRALFTTSYFIATFIFIFLTTIRNLYYFITKASKFISANLLKDYLWGIGTLLLMYIFQTVLRSLFYIELL
jgi:membrane-associated HD superfamily phosphohydrolase